MNAPALSVFLEGEHPRKPTPAAARLAAAITVS
jgi:hypothetical protein